MNFDQLKTFHKVAMTGSFTKAAKEIFLTQPAVSQQIQALESSLGISPVRQVRQKSSPHQRGGNPFVIYQPVV